MPATAHMKILLHEAEIEHQYRRRQSHVDDPRYKGRAHDYSQDPKIKKRTVIYDDTHEKLDSYSNIDVGTRFRHLPFVYNKHGKRIGSRNEPLNFGHIVDLDTSYYNRVVYTTFLREVLASIVFRSIMMFLVFVNAIVIGMNTGDVNDHWKKELEIIDQVLFTAFAFEIFIKMTYDFRAFGIVSWNILDFLILMWIVYATCFGPVFLSPRTLLITVRVAQALRSLRFLSILSSLTVVSHTMFKSFVDMVNILFVLIIFMVVMAIAGVVLFEDERLKTSRFLSALDAWFVLFICVTQDGWIEVLNQFRETGFFVMISVYLIIGVIIGAFVFANLIIAVVVANLESSIKAIKADKVHTSNPLEYSREFSANEVDIIPVYKPFRRHFRNLLEQRPFIAPRLKTARRRKLRCYVHLLVALEQNMLEYSSIEDDLIRLLSVFLSIFDQLETDEAVSEKNKKRFLEMAKAKYDQPLPGGSTKIERPRKFLEPSKTPQIKPPEKSEDSNSYDSSSDYSI